MTTTRTPYSIAYYTSWCNYAPRHYAPWSLPVEKLSHIFYAFAKIVNNEIACGDPWADDEIEYSVPMPNGTYQLFKGNFGVLNDLQSPLRQRNPNLKTLISVGGWTQSKEFSSMAKSLETRSKFIQSVVRFLQVHRFDGVDIDWEYPVEGGMHDNTRDPRDGHHFGLLLLELRLAFQTASLPALITVATSASPEIYQHLDFAAIQKSCDWVNVMTYDATGPWSEKTGHHAALYPFAQQAIQDYISRGIPSHQLCLGVPFYGRGFANVTDPRPGCLTESHPAPMGTHEPGVFDYHTLIALTDYERHYHPETPVLYSPQHRIWISYDTPESIDIKAQYVLQQQLAGIFFWEASMDGPGCPLVTAIHEGFSKDRSFSFSSFFVK